MLHKNCQAAKCKKYNTSFSLGFSKPALVTVIIYIK